MKKKIPLGIKEYRKLKENNYYAVDKSLMIEEFLASGSEVTLITRPRRFGKTLNMSMLSEFFDITKESGDLFKDTLIASSPFYNEMNQYPVIYISFADAKGSKVNIISFIKDIILEQYECYDYIFNDIKGIAKIRYEKIINACANDESTLNVLGNAISFLMSQMEKYYSKKVMLFIDEYDTPFIEAYTNGFYKDINKDLSIMLQSALKTTSSLQYGLLTGIQRVAKENIFSDLNNLKVCTVTNHQYNKYFGFNPKETEKLLKYYDLQLDDDVKAMYDGYRFGNQEIYNPWSIINYADNKELVPYWVNTSSNRMIKQALDHCDEEFYEKFDLLIDQGYLDTSINLTSSFYEDSSTYTLWGLFINAGYLTIEKEIREDRFRIRIPNNEIRREFIDLTAHRIHVTRTVLDALYDSFRFKDLIQFKGTYQQILMKASFHDLKNENSYHALMLGLSVGLWNEYEIESNREEGLGRCDIILRAKGKQPSYVLEFKYLKNEKDLSPEELEEPLTKLANEALEQIVAKKYDYNLSGEVIHIGLGHAGKTVKVLWKELNK